MLSAVWFQIPKKVRSFSAVWVGFYFIFIFAGVGLLLRQNQEFETLFCVFSTIFRLLYFFILF